MLAGTGALKISSVACGFSSIEFNDSDYLKSLISRINEFYEPFCCNHTCYCVNTVSVMSAARFITSASGYHLGYSMYIRGLIPRNFAVLAEAVRIGS